MDREIRNVLFFRVVVQIMGIPSLVEGKSRCRVSIRVIIAVRLNELGEILMNDRLKYDRISDACLNQLLKHDE